MYVTTFFKTRSLKYFSQIGHFDQLVSSNVDSAQKGDVFSHSCLSPISEAGESSSTFLMRKVRNSGPSACTQSPAQEGSTVLEVRREELYFGSVVSKFHKPFVFQTQFFEQGD